MFQDKIRGETGRMQEIMELDLMRNFIYYSLPLSCSQCPNSKILTKIGSMWGPAHFTWDRTDPGVGLEAGGNLTKQLKASTKSDHQDAR